MATPLAVVMYLGTDGGLTRGVCLELGAGEMLVELREPLEPGETVRATFAGEDGAELTFQGRVRVAETFSRTLEVGGHHFVRPGAYVRLDLEDPVEDAAPVLMLDVPRQLH